MLKKILGILFIFSILQFVITISCGPPETEYRKIYEIETINYDFSNKTALKDSAQINQKDFKLHLKLNTQFFSVASSFNSAIFINSAYATSLPEPFYLGLNPKIQTFNIVCNKTILGINSGEDVKSKLKLITLDNANFEIEKWIDALNRGVFTPDGIWEFEFREPVNSEEFLVFEVSLKLLDGTVLSKKTNAVKIDQ